MKKLCVMMALALLLCGCGEAQTFETVADEMVLPVSAQPREILLNLPEDTLLPVMETDEGCLYFCNGFDVAVQTFQSGDVDATIRQVTGFGKDNLTVLQTSTGQWQCYEFVWTAATELGEQVGRAMILDDGDFHYVLSAVAPAKNAQEYQEIWNGIFETFGIA